MPENPTLKASKRTIIGKKVKRLRRDGKAPAIIYGPVIEKPLPVTIDTKELDRTYHDYGSFTLIDVQVEDDQDYTVYIRDVESDLIYWTPMHAELYAPNLNVAMTAQIPIHMVGESPSRDGAVTQTLDTVELSGLPANLPSVIEVDVSRLEEIDASIYVSELEIPDNVELLTDPEELIVRLMAVQTFEEEEEAAAAEAEEVEVEEEAAEEPEAEEAEEAEEEETE